MKFDSTLVNVEGKDIVIVAVDTHFFSLPQEEKGELVRNFFEYFKKPISKSALHQKSTVALPKIWCAAVL